MARPLLVVKRRWWLIAIAAAIGGVVAYASAGRDAEGYTARALVVATSPTVPSDQVATVLQSIAGTDAVADPTTEELAVDEATEALARSGDVSVTPGTSDLGVNVVARSTDPGFAADLANRTATNLADVANGNGFGTYAVFPSNGPGVARPELVVTIVAAGALLGGILAALALVAIATFRRRPAEAEDVAYADAVFRVNAVRVAAEDGSADGHVAIEPSSVVESLRRAVSDRGRPDVETVLVPSPASWACSAVERRLVAGDTDGDGRARGGRGGRASSSADARTVVLIAGEDTPLPRVLEARAAAGIGGDRTVVLVLVNVPGGTG